MTPRLTLLPVSSSFLLDVPVVGFAATPAPLTNFKVSFAARDAIACCSSLQPIVSQTHDSRHEGEFQGKSMISEGEERNMSGHIPDELESC
jgi:hypothetical protein